MVYLKRRSFEDYKETSLNSEKQRQREASGLIKAVRGPERPSQALWKEIPE